MKQFFDILFVIMCICEIAYLIETYQTMTVGSFVLNLFFIAIVSSAFTIYVINFIYAIAKKKREDKEEVEND